MSPPLLNRLENCQAMQHVHPIDGSTKVYLILADPIEQVVAPRMFNKVFSHMGINAVVIPAHVRADSFISFVHTVLKGSTNIHGLWISIPHKSSTFTLLSQASELARIAMAANAVKRLDNGQLEGALFDGEGLIASLNYFQIPFRGKKILLLGAGGAAAAIATSLAVAADRKPSLIAIFDPSHGKAAQVVSQISANTTAALQIQANNDPQGFDLIINASPLGLSTNDPLPCDVSRLSEGASVVDILMKNQPTPFVRAVRQRGLVAQPGFEMLIQQVPMYLDFFGYHDAAEVMREQPNFLREFVYPDEMKGEIHTLSR